MSRTRRSFLWIKGKAGSGKSTLMKTIIAQIRALPSGPVVISFFFDARGNLLERSPLGLFRTLIKELISERPHLLEQLLPLYEKLVETGQVEWRMHDLHKFFEQAIEDQKLGPMYVFIDALDECEEEDIDQRTSRDHDTNARTLVRFFESLMISSKEPENPLLLCLSSRHYPHISVRKDVNLFEVSMEDENDEDIRKFVESTLVSSSLDTDLVQDNLLNMIAQRSRGVFLWSVLVIQALLRARDQGRPRSQWSAILEEIPDTLNETFHQAMGNLRSEDRLASAILFEILVRAKESMSLDCVRLAMAFAVNEAPASLEIWRISDDYLSREAFGRRIRDLSCGLVEVKASPELLFFDYNFLPDERSTKSPARAKSDLRRQASLIPGTPYRCTATELANDDAQNGEGLDDQGEGHQIVQFIHETVRTFFIESKNTGRSEFGRPNEKVHELVLQACLNFIATSDAGDWLSGVGLIPICHFPGQHGSHTKKDQERYRTSLSQSVPFLPLAVSWLHEHLVSAETKRSERHQVDLIRRLGGPSNEAFEAWKGMHYCMTGFFDESNLDFYIRSQADFFDYAAIHGLSYAVSAGLRDSTGIGPQTPMGVTPLMRLLNIRCDRGARLLVAQGMDVRARDDFGRSVLFYARSVEMVQMLLDAGAEVNGIWNPSLTPIVGLCSPAHCGIGVNALMYHIKDVDMVKCLLQAGADVDETSLTGETALQYAPSEAVTELLLAKRPRHQSTNTDDGRLSDTT